VCLPAGRLEGGSENHGGSRLPAARAPAGPHSAVQGSGGCRVRCMMTHGCPLLVTHGYPLLVTHGYPLLVTGEHGVGVAVGCRQHSRVGGCVGVWLAGIAGQRQHHGRHVEAGAAGGEGGRGGGSWRILERSGGMELEQLAALVGRLGAHRGRQQQRAAARWRCGHSPRRQACERLTSEAGRSLATSAYSVSVRESMWELQHRGACSLTPSAFGDAVFTQHSTVTCCECRCCSKSWSTSAR